MIDPKQLLTDLQKLLKRLEPDIRNRCESNPGIDARLHGEYDKAKSASRTAQAYEVWRDDYITQVAVAWILGCVFVRFLEDNRLIDTAWLAGPNVRLQLARDQHTLYFQTNPTHSDREYLEHVFSEVAKLPSMRELLDGSHNPVSKVGPTGDGAHELLTFWQKVDPSTGMVIHDFTDPDWNTRFLGDLYQDLSKSARKRFALLQTPDFVEEFILDRTLTPAIDEFGYSKVRIIDPACGSGHFLLGAFQRLCRLRAQHEPGTNPRALTQSVLDAVCGVDLNPFAVAIARFRLLVASLRSTGETRMADAPNFRINLAAGDSLLHGPRLGSERDRESYLEGLDPLQHVYETEDAAELQRLLGQQYHAVVGNPPYIIVSDSALNSEYRKRFGSCHRQYSLAVPFMERFFHLALKPNGYVGMITANSFMKREFGKKLIEQYISRWDLTHIIDTSRAHIPAHGTPTVILIGRNSSPRGSTIRAVMGIRAEAKTPENPARGLVWQAIIDQVDLPGSESAYVSVADRPRSEFSEHPWSIGGGGAAELKSLIESLSPSNIRDCALEIGRTTHTGEDDAFYFPEAITRTYRWDNSCVPLVTGEDVRDYSISPTIVTLFPYDKRTGDAVSLVDVSVVRHFWTLRTGLRNRRDYNHNILDRGLRWFDHSMFFKKRFSTSLSIAFAFVATHNHFALDRGGKVFKQSAPVIKLKDAGDETRHLEILGALNTSTGCFWMKQTFHNKGGGGIGGGLATEEWEQFYEFDSTKLLNFPLPSTGKLVASSKTLDSIAAERRGCLSSAFAGDSLTASALSRAEHQSAELLARMISIQEELDWGCYKQYGLLQEDLTTDSAPPIRLGERAFEILLARKIDEGELETTWFQRHGATPVTDLPDQWPHDYRTLVARRISVIQTDPRIGLIEQPEYKRRWNLEPWSEQVSRALREWLIRLLENLPHWASAELSSCAKLGDCVRSDTEFRQVAELYRGRQDFEWTSLIAELIEAESVPLLPVLRYTESGIRKRELWARTWDLQRREDAIDAQVQADSGIPIAFKGDVARRRKAEEIGDIPSPPKYDPKDFRLVWGICG